MAKSSKEMGGEKGALMEKKKNIPQFFKVRKIVFLLESLIL